MLFLGTVDIDRLFSRGGNTTYTENRLIEASDIEEAKEKFTKYITDIKDICKRDTGDILSIDTVIVTDVIR